MAAVIEFLRSHPREFSTLVAVVGVCFSPFLMRRKR